MKGCVELNKMVEMVDADGYRGVLQHPIGLAKMSAMYLGRRVIKDRDVRASNWERTLSDQQLSCQSNSTSS